MIESKRDELIHRLRRSKSEEQHRDRGLGFECGHKWATETATATELERCAGSLAEIKALRENLQGGTENPLGVLFRAVYREASDEERSKFNAIFEGVKQQAEQPPLEGEFAFGFVEGASCIWAEVKDDI